MPTPRAIRPENHPFPLLLYLEWALLGLAVFSELTPRLLPRAEVTPVIAIACVILFAGLGLWLPQTSSGWKLAHTAGQFGVILLASRIGLASLRLFPLLYIVLVIRSCLMFGQRGRLLVAGIAFVLFLGVVQNRMRSLDGDFPGRIGQWLLPQLMGFRLNLVLMFAVVLIFVLLLVNALLSERERREELRRANQKLRDSAAQIERLAMAQERSRIAREIHDALGHALTGLNIQLEGALKFWEADPQQARQFVAQAKELGSTALQEVRQAVATLREPPTQKQDWRSAIAQLTDRFQQMTEIFPHVTLDCPPLPPSLQLTVYRIVQEALTNICKYAQATSVNIAIHSTASPRPGLSISIQDDGIGFNLADNRTGYGIQGMKERAEAEGGQFRLVSAPGAGCTVHVWLPLPLEGV